MGHGGICVHRYLWFLVGLMATTDTRSAAGPPAPPLGSTAVVAGTADVSGEPQTADGSVDPEMPDAAVADVVTLDEPRLTESSGLAFSGVRAGHVWTHNDSGGRPRLFAFDAATGRKTGECRLLGAEAVDWEDLAAFRQDDIPRLIVADVGDNRSRRDSVVLYLLDEPDPAETQGVASWDRLVVRYPDGPRDCEAVAVDPARGVILMLEKSWTPVAGIYTLPLPDRDAAADSARTPAGRTRELTARRIGQLYLPLITAADFDPVSGDVWVSGYFQAFGYACENRDEDLRSQFGRLPHACGLPRWRQIEAIAVQEAGRVWVTTEGAPAKLGRLTCGPGEPPAASPDSEKVRPGKARPETHPP